MLLGDTHANLVSFPFIRAMDEGAEAIVQLGDFGYRYEPPFIKKLCRLVRQYDIPVYFIDGNHDRFQYMIDRDAWGQSTFQEIWDNIFYIPRGMAWEWSGVKFIGIGGAYSIDRPARQLDVSWWEEELITEEEVSTAISHGECDILLTHDAPYGVTPLEGLLDNPERNRAIEASGHCRIGPESKENRQLLEQVVLGTSPNYLFHGHYHFHYDGFVFPYGLSHPVSVHGLDQGGDGITIDLEDPKWKTPLTSI